MDYFNDVHFVFVPLSSRTLVVYAGSESSQISLKCLNLCSEYEWRSHLFRTEVIIDRIMFNFVMHLHKIVMQILYLHIL